jgi:hypothetical protein
MGAFIANARARLHLVVTLLSIWLVCTSPWTGMLRRMPRDPGIFDYAHVWLGAAASAVGILYAIDCLRNGGWRLSFPLFSGGHAAVAADLRGLFRGRLPAAEGGGLLGAIAGFALLAFLAVALTGVAWILNQGSPEALDWRAHHAVAVRVFIVLLVTHVVAVSLHVLDFVRE